MQSSYSDRITKSIVLTINLIIVFSFVSCMKPKPAKDVTTNQKPVATSPDTQQPATTKVDTPVQPQSSANQPAKADNPNTLELGKPLERELKGGEAQNYELKLAANQYLQAVVEQKGIDVVVAVYAPDGQKIYEVDSPNGTEGPEPAYLVAEVAGNYRLEVRSDDILATAGKYEAKITELRIANDKDKVKVAGYKAYNEALSLEGEIKPEEVNQAIAKYEEAIPLFQSAGEFNSAAISLNYLARRYQFKGDYGKAELLYKRSLAIYEKVFGPEYPEIGISLDSLAELYESKGDYDNAELFYKRSLELAEKTFGPEHREVTVSLSNLAMLYESKGDYDNAELFYKKSLAIIEKALGSDQSEVSICLNNLGNFYVDTKEEYEKAEPLYQRSLAIVEKALGPDHFDVSMACERLGILYVHTGKYEKAESLFQRSLVIRERGLRSDYAAFSYGCLGELYKAKGEYEKAESSFQQALILIEKSVGPDSNHMLYFYNKLAVFYQAKGDIKKAIIYRNKGNEKTEKNFLYNLSTGSEKQKLLYINQTAYEQDFTISLNLQSAPKDLPAAQSAMTVILRRKGRALDATTNAIANLRARASKADLQLLDDLSQAKALQSTLTLKGPGKEGIDKHREQIQTLEKQVEELENKISARSSEFKVINTPINLQTVQQAIPDNAGLIEFVNYRPYDAKARKYDKPHYAVYTLNNKGDLQWADLGEAAPIDQAANEFRQLLTKQPDKPLSNVENELKPKARTLDKLVMQPVRQLLGDKKRLLISPDGLLNLIPFDALVDEQGRYLVESYEISYLTSGRDLLRLQNGIKSEQAPIVMADPNYGDGPGTKMGNLVVGGERLKGTADEANQIKQTLGLQVDEILLQDQATKLALKQLHRPEILHIATHGFFLKEQEGSAESRRTRIKSGAIQSQEAEQTVTQKDVEEFKLSSLLKSGLLLAGANKGNGDEGVLTALEATTLDLWGTKLVVLSACDTGVGEIKNGDGVYGLRRALVLAGSESQLMSLWSVSDVGTRDLMLQYYQALKAGEGRSAGLRRVRLEFLKDVKHQHPYYWASFIQSGEWANLEGKR